MQEDADVQEAPPARLAHLASAGAPGDVQPDPLVYPPPTTTTVLSLPLTQMHREQASGL